MAGITAEEALGISRKYTRDSLDGVGALKGKNATIASITDITGGKRVTFQWTSDSGVVQTSTMNVMNGADGRDGTQGPKGDTGAQGIQGIQGIKGDKGDDGYPFLIYKQYDTISEFDASDFPEIGLMFMIMTYEQDHGYPVYRYTAESPTPYSLVTYMSTEGIKGDKGDKGDTGAQGIQGPKGDTGADGEDGEDGEDGVGITSITFKETDAQGNNVYTITLSDSTTYDFTAPKGPKGDTGSGGGTDDYEELNNLPSINGVELLGNKEIGMLSTNIHISSNVIGFDSGYFVPQVNTVKKALESLKIEQGYKANENLDNIKNTTTNNSSDLARNQISTPQHYPNNNNYPMFVNNKYVYFDNSKVYTSDNEIDWTENNCDLSGSIICLGYKSGYARYYALVSVNGGAFLYYSSNLQTWTRANDIPHTDTEHHNNGYDYDDSYGSFMTVDNGNGYSVYIYGHLTYSYERLYPEVVCISSTDCVNWTVETLTPNDIIDGEFTDRMIKYNNTVISTTFDDSKIEVWQTTDRTTFEKKATIDLSSMTPIFSTFVHNDTVYIVTPSGIYYCSSEYLNNWTYVEFGFECYQFYGFKNDIAILSYSENVASRYYERLVYLSPNYSLMGGYPFGYSIEQIEQTKGCGVIRFEEENWGFVNYVYRDYWHIDRNYISIPNESYIYKLLKVTPFVNEVSLAANILGLGSGSGGGSGTSDYSDLTNKPSINGVELLGNKLVGLLSTDIQINAEKIGYSGTVSGASTAKAAIESLKSSIDNISVDADDVSYDNTTSGLTSTNVQDAIDEIVGDMPQTDIYCDLSKFTGKKLMIAHRGASYECPEQSLAAYNWAGKFKFDGAECDVQFTSDNVPILMHDSTVDRTTNGSGTVASLTASQITALTIDYAENASGLTYYPNEKVPTLEQYLKVCKYWGMFPVIEIKETDLTIAKAQIIVDLVVKYGLLEDAIFIGWVQNNLLNLMSVDARCKCMPLIDITQANVDWCVEHKMIGIDCDYTSNLTQSKVQLCHDNGLLVGMWTINDTTNAMTCNDYGVDMQTSNSIEFAFDCYNKPSWCDYDVSEMHGITPTNTYEWECLALGKYLKRVYNANANVFGYDTLPQTDKPRAVLCKKFNISKNIKFSYSFPSTTRVTNVTMHGFYKDSVYNAVAEDIGWFTTNKTDLYGISETYTQNVSEGIIYIGTSQLTDALTYLELEKLYKDQIISVVNEQPKITASTTDITAGSTALATGDIYVVYE